MLHVSESECSSFGWCSEAKMTISWTIRLHQTSPHDSCAEESGQTESNCKNNCTTVPLKLTDRFEV